MVIRLDKLKLRHDNYIASGIDSIDITLFQEDKLETLIEEVNKSKNSLQRFEMLGYLLSQVLYEEINEKSIILCKLYLHNVSLPTHIRYLFAKIMVSRHFEIGSIELAAAIFEKFDVSNPSDLIFLKETDQSIRDLIKNMSDYM